MRRRSSSYKQAVILLGGESTFGRLLDRTSAIALLGLGALDLMDARAEIVRLTDEMFRKLRDKAKGLSRYDRTERLLAAHTVLVVTAYFEALAEAAPLPAAEVSEDDRRRLTGQDSEGHWVHELLELEMPSPAPDRPHEDLLAALEGMYRGFSGQLAVLLMGLAVWDQWDETQRDLVLGVLRHEVPALARRRYEEHFRDLCGQFPEVACWVDLSEHQATRTAVRELRQGLAGLADQLARTHSRRGPSDRLNALVRANRAVLGRPVVTTATTPVDMRIPTLERAYVDPGFRAVTVVDGGRPAEEDFWSEHPRLDPLNEFLTGYLTLPKATEGPLVVLGQPGAGKSMLTKMLAARLPAGDFLPLRVELRGVPADSDVLGQIQHAIRDALDEPMSWPELVDAAQGALPVVLLDGFDELLQTTGVNHTDYLMRVAEFQRAQMERGRPLAVVLTSRMAVADRMTLPRDTTVLRLEPFDEGQVRHWIGEWNRGNAAYFAGRGLDPLSAEAVLAVSELAVQPLLLLMLALYDAEDDNALQRAHGELDEADLYERLLLAFSEREVRKTHEGIEEPDLARAMEEELNRLSVTAFAMFNRGRQWVAEPDLENDFAALGVHRSADREPDPGFRRALSQTERVVGGFFFVHQARALRDDRRLKTYEFLHATFGEYLVARLLARKLADCADELVFYREKDRPDQPDTSFLRALLSYSCLTDRGPILRFLRSSIAARVSERARPLLLGHLCRLFAAALDQDEDGACRYYRPHPFSLPYRYAAYSANLLLLCVLAAGRPLAGTELFAQRPGAAVREWTSRSRYWQSQLSGDTWDALIRAVRVQHFSDGTGRGLTVREEDDTPFKVTDLGFFTLGLAGRSESVQRGFQRLRDLYGSETFGEEGFRSDIREMAFLDDDSKFWYVFALLPYARNIGNGVFGLPILDDGLSPPPARVLMDLLFTDEWNVEDRVQRYRWAIHYSTRATRNDRYFETTLRYLFTDQERLPTQDVLSLLVECVDGARTRRQAAYLQEIATSLGRRMADDGGAAALLADALLTLRTALLEFGDTEQPAS